MSLLCAAVPDFLLALALRRPPQPDDPPLGLLGADDRVWALSPQARTWGVETGQPARAARARCPHLTLRPLDLAAAQAAQEHFLAELLRWELPVEEQGWGMGYVDLHSVAARPDDVRPLALELGRRLRTALGDAHTPGLGWDAGKFTARAASACARPGTLRLVAKADERRFLTPLPVSLLPLPDAALRELRWLGIHTLGQFAALPSVAVWQRWGQPGKLAHRWAQGRDTRPVAPAPERAPEPLRIDLDPPTEQVGRALANLTEAFRPTLKRLAANLCGLRRLRLHLHFLPTAERTLELPFVLPTCQEARVHAALAHALQTLVWPGELERAELTLLAVGELLPGQLALFDEPAPDDSPVALLAHRLAGRYGRCFFMGQVTDERHPVAERAVTLQPL